MGSYDDIMHVARRITEADDAARAVLRVAVVVSVAAPGQITTDATGTAVLRCLTDAAPRVGDRVALLVQGRVGICIGIFAGAGPATTTDLGNVSGAVTVPMTGGVVRARLIGNATFTPDAAAPGVATTTRLLVAQDAVGGRTFLLGAGVRVATGSVGSSAANSVVEWSLTNPDGGATTYAHAAGTYA